ncbi:hypothetical protein [Aureivirga sp. CE67]|uniref:hypothetical protein n=1 Tax=Aureivirga sp. CE67 TaxID=1788983 RepID=UPI0018CA4259|nr:hypothetical protein [Aureivirga sp. CE67]
MKAPFRLSVLNIIFLCITALLVFILQILITGINEFHLGFAFGSVIGVLITPTLIAFIVWLIRKREKYAGTYTFNVILLLMLLGNLSDFIQSFAIPTPKSDESVIEMVKDFNDSYNNEDFSVVEGYEKLTSNVNNSLEESIKKSTGKEKEILLINYEFLKFSELQTSTWLKTITRLEEPNILDLKVLMKTKDYKERKEVFNEVRIAAINYHEFINNRERILNELTKDIDRSHEAYKMFRAGFDRQVKKQEEYVDAYIKAYISYTENLVSLMDFLEKEDGKWMIEESGNIKFENDKLQDSCYEIIIKATQDEVNIADLSEKLWNSM